MSAVAPDAEQNAWLRDPDVQRMLRVRDGDDEAFAELVATWQDRLIGLFNQLIRDQQVAEDLAQEVFLRIYKARDRYTPTAKFSTWMFRIANNLAMNKRRSASWQRETGFQPSDSGPLGARPEEQIAKEKSALMPARQFDRKEMCAAVNDAIQDLNERQKMALFLNKFEHMSYADIAVSMDLSVQAVKSLLTRARESLRVRLESYLQAD